MNKTYYQPERNGELPEELYSFQVFKTYQECVDWLYQHDYDEDDWNIVEYHDGDIENPTFIDEYGDEIKEFFFNIPRGGRVMEKRVTLEVNGKKLHLVLGKTVKEWEETFDQDYVWDVLLEELLDGTLEIEERIWYWYIDGRCYETFEEV